MTSKNYDSLFSTNEIKLKNQKVGKILCINMFRAVKTRFGDTYLCYNAKYNLYNLYFTQIVNLEDI